MLVNKIGQNFIRPVFGNAGMPEKNYYDFNQPKVDHFVSHREAALPYLENILKTSNNEAEIIETLYIIDRQIEAGMKPKWELYPTLARFNNTNSPGIQTYLAGIYRKMQVPDAFGPLVAMLIRNSIRPQSSNFDPNEEIGGAILSYVNPRFQAQPQ